MAKNKKLSEAAKKRWANYREQASKQKTEATKANKQPEIEAKKIASVCIKTVESANSMRDRLEELRKKRQEYINTIDAEIKETIEKINNYTIFLEKEQVILRNTSTF